MKKSQNVVEYSLAANWDSAVLVREQTAAVMREKGFDNAVTEAVTMCITELTENAIKYGTDAENGTQIQAQVTHDQNHIVVSVSNHTDSERKLHTLTKTIDALRGDQSPGELHIQRLREIMKNPKRGSSRLGIYRIAYEGDFSVSYQLEDGLLTIVATRKLDGAT